MPYSETWRALGKPKGITAAAFLSDGYAYADVMLNDFFAPEATPEPPAEEEPPVQILKPMQRCSISVGVGI